MTRITDHDGTDITCREERMGPITIDVARGMHPGSYIEVVDHADADGTAYPAVYVWRNEKDSIDDDGARAIAMYWLDKGAE